MISAPHLYDTAKVNALCAELTPIDELSKLVASINEGMLIVARDHTVLYANQCFAEMTQLPIEQLNGASLLSFFSSEDEVRLSSVFDAADESGSKLQVILNRADGTPLSVLISMRGQIGNSGPSLTFGVIVTDMTETCNGMHKLPSFSQRLLEAQEVDRERVALALHGHITQLLCAILMHSEVIAIKLPANDLSAKRDMKKLRKMIGEAASAVERISRHLRPSALNHLGLGAMLQSDTNEFSNRTGIPLSLNCGPLTKRLPPAAELACYRILQEALKNVENHAQAKHVTIHLTESGAFVEISIEDDGIGFDPALPNLQSGIGIHSMHERATAVGAVVRVKSALGQGTSIHTRVPLGE